VYKNKKLKFF
jgi:hypothetical protein